MRILSGDGSIDNGRQGWHCVGSVPCHLLAHVVDHCKPANIAFLTADVVRSSIYKRRRYHLCPLLGMPSILKRKIEKAFCRKIKAKMKRELESGKNFSPWSNRLKMNVADCLLSSHLRPSCWKSSCCSLEESFSIAATVLPLLAFSTRQFQTQ